MSPSTAKQARILGESSSGSGEDSVHFKVVYDEWCATMDVARPHTFELRPRRGVVSEF